MIELDLALAQTAEEKALPKVTLGVSRGRPA
jgi:hypothetical protein